MTHAPVTDDGKLTVDVPSGIEPGEHHVVIAIDERPEGIQDVAPLEFRNYPLRFKSDSFTCRREDIYGGDGR